MGYQEKSVREMVWDLTEAEQEEAQGFSFFMYRAVFVFLHGNLISFKDHSPAVKFQKILVLI